MRTNHWWCDVDFGYGLGIDQLFGGRRHSRCGYRLGARHHAKQVCIFIGAQCIFIYCWRFDGDIRGHRSAGSLASAISHELRY